MATFSSTISATRLSQNQRQVRRPAACSAAVAGGKLRLMAMRCRDGLRRNTTATIPINPPGTRIEFGKVDNP